MSDKPVIGRRGRALWPLLGALLVGVSFLGVSAVPAAAESSSYDARRYASILQNVFDFVLENYVEEVDPALLYEGAMKGMFDALGDPHSVYLDAAMMSDMSDTTTGEYGGIGTYISKIPPDALKPGDKPWVEIVSPIEDTPAWKAGIRPGDWIKTIDGEPTDSLSMDEVLLKIRGKPGTPIVITILRGESLTFELTLERARIEIPNIKREMIPGGTGYLRIIEFTPQTATRVKESLDYFAANGYRNLVIDLRNNPGGLLQAAVQVADLFLDSGVIVSTKSRLAHENLVYRAERGVAVPAGLPIVVLINKGSASASEILAGALKDHRKAYLIGETSYGKGSVQQIYPIGDGGFKLTMSRYYTPSDANIDKIGIAPDLEVREPDLTGEEEEALTRIFDERLLETFARENPEAPRPTQDAFVRKLLGSGFKVREDLLRRLVRDEIGRTSIAPVYDLEFDIQLQAALEAFKSGNFTALLAATRSVRELQGTAAVAADILPLPKPPSNQ